MSKILLINSPNRKSEPPRHYPYGLGILSAILKQNNYPVEFMDGNFMSLKESEDFLSNKKYDFIGVSGLITTYLYQKEIIKIAKNTNPNAIISAGGGLASAVQSQLLELIPELDVAFVGESETNIIPFMKNMKVSLSEIPGIVYRTGKNIIKNQPVDFIEKLDTVPYPDLEILNLHKYFENKSFPLSPNVQSAQRRGNVLVSRGCPYHCDFCFNTLGREKIRYRSAENVLSEIKMLTDRHAIDFISFMDESFLTSRKLTGEICEGMKKIGKNVKWGIAARSTSTDPEILSEIKSAGCDYIYFGFDSGSEETLVQMNKKMTLDDNFNAFKESVEAGIYPVPNIIIGYDNESLKNIEENYAFFKRLIDYGKTLKSEAQREVFERGFNNFGAIYFATPYPGSKLYERTKHRLPPLEEVLKRVSFKDAYELTVNVSQIPDDTLVKEQKKMENFVRGFRL